ncbi:MAG: L-threonylcarbamoyladenylate synthase [Candidatus Paceibacterota bacterium]
MLKVKRINPAIKKIVRSGGVGVMPTDTIYGLVGSAMIPETVERIYKLRRRDPKKPLIVLIDKISDLKKFKITLNPKLYNLAASYWPGPVSIILPCPLKNFSYLHRGTKTIAFRLPKLKWLIEFLDEVGPLVAPSANPADRHPARNIRHAVRYFGNQVDFYIDSGEKKITKPSTLLKITEKGIETLRQ